MKKILIMTAGFGEGHNAAARGLLKALQENHADQVEAELVDVVDLGYPNMSQWAKKSYGKIISHAPRVWSFIYNTIDNSEKVRQWLVISQSMVTAMGELLREKQPDLVVSTYPAYAHQLAELQKRYPDEQAYKMPYVKIVTDSITINRVWIGEVADEFIVPNVETGEALEKLGIPPKKINDNGFPVNPAFAGKDVTREPLENGKPARVLMMLNTDSRQYINLAQELAKREDVRITVTVGRRPDLQKELEDLLKDSPCPAEVKGWVDDVAAMMLSHHLLIGKAGGATVQEAIAARLPMVVAEVLPGQEEGNALLLESKGVGRIAKGFEEIPAILDEMRADNSRLWKEWAANLEKVSTPDAALRLAQHLVEKISPKQQAAPSSSS